MTDHVKGWTLFIGAIGMMAGLLSPEIAALQTWSAVLTPVFIGKALAHFGVVVGAFVAGKIIPTAKESSL